jgi:hypothetical protein
MKAISNIVKTNSSEILPVFQDIFTRSTLKRLLKDCDVKLYWRILTPLVILWGFIFQRLNKDHTTDAFVSHAVGGGIDHIDREDLNMFPVSLRLKSESTSAYVQGRNRFPLYVLQKCFKLVINNVLNWLQTSSGSYDAMKWKGHPARFLDGTTFRLRPFGDLIRTYSQYKNQLGKSYWVSVKSTISLCLHTRMVIGYAEGPISFSETAFTRDVMTQDTESNSIYIGDRGFGVYRVVQTAFHCGYYALLRLESKVAKSLLKESAGRNNLRYNCEEFVFWSPKSTTKTDPDLPNVPIPGRLIFALLTQPGFRPIELYLFTTLLDDKKYSINDLVELYGLRWNVEVDYRHIKTSLDMDGFDVQSTEMFRKELAAGLLAYNLICIMMVRAALSAEMPPRRLSFKKCCRRLRTILFEGFPYWVSEYEQCIKYLLERLARCRLPVQNPKCRHEPRKVRQIPQVFPNLRGDRNVARKQCLEAIQAQNS